MARSLLETISKKPITWILVLAFLLRVWGIDYGFPLFLVNDEPALVLGALKMIELRTLIPALHEDEFRKVLNYPPIPSYFYLATLAPVIAVHYLASGMPPLAEYQNTIILDPSFLWIAARILNALLGVIVIYLTYRLARRVTGSESSALFGAIFLSLSFYHIQLSQVVRQWMPALVFVTAAWLMAVRILSDRKWSSYLLGGVSAGLAAGINTSGAIACIPLVLAHAARTDIPFIRKYFSKQLWTMIIIAVSIVAVSTILYPFGFTRAEGGGTVGGDLVHRIGFLAEKSFNGWLEFLGGYVALFSWYETTLLFAALIGVVALFRNQKQFIGMTAVFVLGYITLLYCFFNPIPRALIFLLPPLAVLAGAGADWCRERCVRMFSNTSGRAGIYAVVGASALFFAYPLLIDVRYSYLFAQDDTRLVAGKWIEEHIQPNTGILADLQYLRLTNTKEGIRELERIHPAGLRSADRVLEKLPDAQYPAPAFNVLNLHFVGDDSPIRRETKPAFFRARGYRYFVVEYEYRDQSDLDPRTRELVSGLKRIEHFTPYRGQEFDRALDLSGEIATIHPLDLFRFERFGQFVDVYQL